MSSGTSGAADRSSLENRLSGEEFEVDVRFARTETCFRVFNPLKYHRPGAIVLVSPNVLSYLTEIYFTDSTSKVQEHTNSPSSLITNPTWLLE